MSHTDSVVTLTFPAKPDYLVLSRLALSGIARSVPLDPDVLADLKLAITEACGNAVRHAYENGDGPVTIAFGLEEGRLEIVVEDRGSGLDAPPDTKWEMPPEPEGGMGLAIISTVVDELEVTRGTGGRGTLVRMTKHLTRSEPSDG
ncbi:MAG: ATP-binding protein [Actinobacteria bacterium]|nr:ATP-binding protein [Actinomycetota bacterium]